MCRTLAPVWRAKLLRLGERELDGLNGAAKCHQERAAEELENRERMYMMFLLFGAVGTGARQSGGRVARSRASG